MTDKISTADRRRLASEALRALEAWQATEPRLTPADRETLIGIWRVLYDYKETGH